MMNNRNHYIFNFEEDSFPAVRPYTSFDSYESNSPPLSGSTYHDTDSVSEKSKIIRKKRNTYQKIDDESRIKLLDLVQQGETLKAAAKRYGINYSSAKSILHTFRKEGRILKKSAQERNARKRTKVASDLEMSPIYPYKTQDSYNETSEDQTYYSSDLKLKSEPSSMSGLTDEESPKIVSGITINSFGDFLKIESQSQKKSDKPAAKSPTSGFVFKFEPQYLQRNPSMEVKGGNWQLNLNVQRSVKSEEANPRVEAEPVLFEKFYSQCSDYSMEINKQMKREELENDAQFFQKRFETITDIITNAEDYEIPQETNYDISCFLNSSPAYAFQPKMSDELDAGSYYNDYGTASSGVVKSAILRTC